METEERPAPAGKTAPKRRGPAAKKSTAIVLDETDSDNDNDDTNDNDFEITQPSAGSGKKKGGRKPAAQNAKKAPAAQNAKKAPAATRKRNVGGKQSQVLGQKLITDMMEKTGISPEKKVRKMRASPFNKKSSSVLGRVAAAPNIEESVSEDLSGGGSAGSNPSPGTAEEEVVEVAAPPSRTRPQRVIRKPMTYVLSDSESDNDSDQNEDYSDFEEEEQEED